MLITHRLFHFSTPMKVNFCKAVSRIKAASLYLKKGEYDYFREFLIFSNNSTRIAYHWCLFKVKHHIDGVTNIFQFGVTFRTLIVVYKYEGVHLDFFKIILCWVDFNWGLVWAVFALTWPIGLTAGCTYEIQKKGKNRNLYYVSSFIKFQVNKVFITAVSPIIIEFESL